MNTLRNRLTLSTLAILIGLLAPSGVQSEQANPPGQPFQILQAQINKLRHELAVAKRKIHNLNQRLAVVESNTVLQLSGVLSLDTTDPTRPTALFNGVNVQIVNGLGATNGNPGTRIGATPAINGLGNLIVGYDEPRLPEEGSSDKSGSHNLIVGEENNYTSYAGVVFGFRNTSASRPCQRYRGGEQRRRERRFWRAQHQRGMEQQRWGPLREH